MAETIAKFQEHKFIVRSREEANTHWESCKAAALFIPRNGSTNWHGLFPLPDHQQDNQNICFGCKTETWARLTRPHVQSPKEAAIEAKEKAVQEKKDEKAKAIAAAAEEKAAKVIAKAKEKITNILT
jgi:hypothetical protein